MTAQAQGICLVTPPSPFLLDERVFVSLGPLRVAAALIEKGVHVGFLDLSGYENFLEPVKVHACEFNVPVYGITATTPQLPAAVEIAAVIRKYRPSARIVLGGPHATLTVAAKQREDMRKSFGRANTALQKLQTHFDVIVAGDGELAVFEALKPEAPRIIDAQHRRSEYYLSNEMYNKLPFPARELAEMDSYKYHIDGVRATSLIGQLGCPYKCTFCAGRHTDNLRVIRKRESQSIIDEMLHIHTTYGYNGFMFYDDELNVNPDMIELMEMIAKVQKDRGLKWNLRGFVKSERFKPEQAKAMYEAGFRQILVGFETGSPRILKNIQKGATRDQNTACMDYARSANLKVKALMSLGHAGETYETAEDTRRWLLDVRPSDFDVTIITPYPGSPYYDDAVRDPRYEDVYVYSAKDTGDKLYQRELDYTKEADYYKGDPNDGYVAHVFTDELTATELVKVRDHLERSVREDLGIPFNPSAAAQKYEHSMGMSPRLPRRLFRTSADALTV